MKVALEPVPIGEVVERVRTWNPSRSPSDELFDYIDLSAVDQDTKSITGAREISCGEAPSRARQLVVSGDILVSTVRPNLNGVARVPEPLDGSTASTGFCVLRANKALADEGYLFQWVKSPGFIADMIGKSTGASYPAVSDRIIFESQIPLPPLAEQQRIAGILDAADALRAKRRESLDQLDSLLQSTFLDLVDHSSASLSSALLSDICQPDAPITYGILQPGPHIEGGIPYVRPSEIKNGQVNLNAIRRTTHNIASKYKKSTLQSGDILITIVGTIGSIAVIPKELEGGNITQSSARVRINRTKAEPLFVEHFLRSKLAKRQYDEKRLGVAVERLNLHHVRDLEVPAPPLPLQKKFAAIVESVERQKARQRAHLAELDALFASLQHRAFRGEL